MPLVSIIIPVRNVCPYIRESLDSVLCQTYEKLEILLIDNDSTDGSENVCEEYALRDKRIRKAYAEEEGLSIARNKGLGMVSGEYIAFLDSDDSYMPDMIEKMLAAAKRENADITTCGFGEYRTEGRMDETEPVRSYVPDKDECVSGVQALNYLLEEKERHFVWNKLYRSELWKDLSFPEGHIYEDLSTVFVLFGKAERVARISESLVRYRHRKGSITQTCSPRHIHDHFRALSMFDRYIRDSFPDEISEKKMFENCENRLRSMIIEYSKLMTAGGKTDMESCNALKEEIQVFRRNLKNRSLKTRAAIGLFMISPKLLCAVRRILGKD